MKYTINELANSKGVSQPVREALLHMEAELDATNRQVEILSDALAESRREVAALKAVQEPVADGLIRQYITALVANKPDEAANATKGMVDYVYTIPLAAQQPDVDAMIAIARADEREACAALADKLEWADNKGVASAIRARGNA